MVAIVANTALINNYVFPVIPKNTRGITQGQNTNQSHIWIIKNALINKQQCLPILNNLIVQNYRTKNMW